MKVLLLLCCWVGTGEKYPLILIYTFCIMSFDFLALVFPFQSNEIDSLEKTSKGFVPLFLAERDVRYYLFSRRNEFVGQEIVWGDAASVRNSNFNGSHPTR